MSPLLCSFPKDFVGDLWFLGPTALQGVPLHGGCVDGSRVMCELPPSPLRPNLWVYLKGFLFVLRVFGFFFVSLRWGPWYRFSISSQMDSVTFHALTDVEMEEQKRGRFFDKVIKLKTELFRCCCFSTVCSRPKVGHSPREKRKVPLGFLNCPKPPPQNSEPLGPMHSCNVISPGGRCQGKRHPFDG